MARTALTIVGGLVGAYFGYPQLGLAVGSLVGNAVDPQRIKGPRIGETGAQTSAEGAPRAIVYGTVSVTGNVIVCGPLVTGEVSSGGGKGGGAVQENEICIRTYAIRICEGPIGGVLRIWEDDKLVYDIRDGSALLAESAHWIFGCGIYLGTETQLPDTFLNINVPPYDHPAYRGTAYMVFVGRDLTDRRGSIPQYRFEVAREISSSAPTSVVAGPGANGFGTYLDVNADGIPFMLQNQTNGSSHLFEVGNPGTYDVDKYPAEFTSIIATDISTITNAGNTAGDQRLWPIAVDDLGLAVSYDANYGYCKVTINGGAHAYLKPTSGAPTSWWYNEAGYYPEYGGLVFITASAIYLGVRTTGSSGTAWDSIYKFPKSSGNPVLPVASISGITGITNTVFYMHVSRAGNVRSIAHNSTGTVKTYDADLNFISTSALPADIAARFPAPLAIDGFGVDETKDMAVYIYGGTNAHVYRFSTGALLGTFGLTGASATVNTRVVFSDEGIYIQRYIHTYFIATPGTYSGLPIVLSDIVADIADRCDVVDAEIDVSELTDEVTGLVLAGDYTGGDAIDSLRSTYFFDKAEYEKKLWFPKRGKAVVDTITIDDLTEIPDLSRREQTLEFPKKMHLQFQHAGSGYATVKATSARSSQDARVVGEVMSQTPVVLNEDQAAQTVAKMHKVAWTEADGEFELSVPESMLAIVPSDCVGVSLRGTVNRYRIEKQLHDSGMLKWTLRRDRQSAYTSNVTGIPIPDPTPPPASIVGDTILVVADISPRQDSEDDLHYLVAVTGANPAWYGALVQRSLDAGASFTQAARITRAARIGELLNVVADADENTTDTTNTVQISLYRSSQGLESITDAEFLSEGGAFLLENADGSFEVMQYRDAVTNSAGDITLSHLHRGRLNSGTNSHAIGAKFVMLEDMTHVVAQSSWIGQTLTHRAPSFEQAAEVAIEQSQTYVGRSQIEWPPASLVLARSGSNIVTGSWAPRYRLGTDDVPVNSINMIGYRITIVGSSTVVLPDQTAASFSYDASALGASVTVSVQTLNRITGPGPATSGTI